MFIDSTLLDKALELHRQFYGDREQARAADQLIEECAELIHAISHARRDRAHIGDVVDEIGDVLICIELFLKVNGVHRIVVDTAVLAKCERVCQRLKKAIEDEATATQKMPSLRSLGDGA